MHLVIVLLLLWGLFIYRNVWPLATYVLQPEDRAEGLLLWIKGGILTVDAVVVPLVSPRLYYSRRPKVSLLGGQTMTSIGIILGSCERVIRCFVFSEFPREENTGQRLTFRLSDLKTFLLAESRTKGIHCDNEKGIDFVEGQRAAHRNLKASFSDMKVSEKRMTLR